MLKVGVNFKGSNEVVERSIDTSLVLDFSKLNDYYLLVENIYWGFLICIPQKNLYPEHGEPF